jgi:hypothetical protein
MQLLKLYLKPFRVSYTLTCESFSFVNGVRIIIEPNATINVGDFSFTSGNAQVEYTFDGNIEVPKLKSCRVESLLHKNLDDYDYHDDDTDPSGVGILVMGDYSSNLVEAC